MTAEIENNLKDYIKTLSTYTSTEEGVTRVVYSEEDEHAKHYIKQKMFDLQLEITEDEIGNIFGIWKGTNPSLKSFWTGSHIDAPTHGGKYDGVVGVISALEAIHHLKQEGMQPERDIVVVVFASEEPTKFGIGCLGSKVLTGKVEKEELKNFRDSNEHTLDEILKKAGKKIDEIPYQKLQPERIHSFLELHIEQGPILETKNIDIGIVDVIAAPTEMNVIIYGEQRHAGSTPMDERKDPYPAAAEAALALEELTKSVSSSSVGTIGKLSVFPGTSNVIPSHVEFSVDIRDTTTVKKDKIVTCLLEKIRDITSARGLTYSYTIQSNDTPSKMDEKGVQKLKSLCGKLGYKSYVMNSGAYHDAMVLASYVPTNLIFVPSYKGISHAPSEYTDIIHLIKGTKVLIDYMKAECFN